MNNFIYYKMIAHLANTNYVFTDEELEIFSHHSCHGLQCQNIKTAYTLTCALSGSACDKLTKKAFAAINRLELERKKSIWRT